MAPVDDLEFLLGKLKAMAALGRALGVEEELRQLRQAAEDAAGDAAERARATGFDYSSLTRYGEISESVDELLQEIWCWDEMRRNSSTSSSVKAAAHVFSTLKFRFAIASRLKEAADLYRKGTTDEDATTCFQSRTSFPGAKIGSVVGREEDVESIIRQIGQLRQQEDHRKLHIIPIVGMPRIGKTTVAQMVYADSRVQGSFDPRIWVHVSPACFDHKVVLRRMAKELVPSMDEDNSVEDEKVLVLLKEKLVDSTKRYLLVLDDVWNEDKDKWEDLQRELLKLSAGAAGGAQGTVIVTTSRYSVVEKMRAANYASSIVGEPYELQGLPADACWQLFRQSLRKVKRARLIYALTEEIGVATLVRRKCSGMPMAVLELAKRIITDLNLFSDSSSESSTPTIPQLEGGSLSLSFELLPIYLRNCFRFCSLFPDDHSFDAEELGDIWRALHFAPSHSRKEESSSWDEARTQYDKLWKECYFHKSDDSTDQDGTYYKMPHVMRQFAGYCNKRSYDLKGSGQTCRVRRMDARLQSSDDSESCRHLSLIVDDSKTSAFPPFQISLNKVKTLILIRETKMVLSNGRCQISVIPTDLLARLENLCVLDLQYTMIKKLPRAVSNLLHLRYLNLSETDIATIPKSVGRLQNLMFLKLVNCRYLRKINDAVCKLSILRKLDLSGCLFLAHVPDAIFQLQCLNIKDCSSLIQMPSRGVGRLTNLRTLPRYIVGEDDGRTISELQNLTGLEGDLRVENLEKVATGADAATAKLADKAMLKSLTLKWKWNHVEEDKDTEAIQEVLEALQPNKKLIKLDIISYMGKQFPSWMGERELPHLDSLVEIKLFNLKECQTLPPLGVLPCLRIAEISGMDSITKVDDSFYGAAGTFPSLQKLTFSEMRELEKWLDVNRKKMFPSLTNLTIINCPELVALEMQLPSVTELTVCLNNEGLYTSKDGLKGVAGSLKKLSISLCEKLLESSECEGLRELPVLQELEISGCQELTSLPRGIRHLKHIQSLTIICCGNKLMDLPHWFKAEFTSLRSLSVNGRNLLAAEVEHSTRKTN